MAPAGPQDPTPDIAIDSGPDPVGPGSHLGPGDLSPGEERLLAALERDVERSEPVISEVRLAEHARRRPPAERAPDDRLVPRFIAPGQD
jgi:hypothetical protein